MAMYEQCSGEDSVEEREREIVNAACFGIMVERTYRNKDKYKESR